MKWFTNLKTRSKILVAFSIIVVMMGVVGCVGILNLQKISTLDNELYENITKPISMVNVIQVDLQKNRVLVRNIIIENDVNKNNESKNTILSNDKEVDMTMEQFKLTIQDQELMNETRNYKSKQSYSSENNTSYKEVAATKSKPKIVLSDNEFGKY